MFSPDVDECVNGSTLCHDLAECIDTIGNYTCECRDGYVGDGVNICDGGFQHNMTGLCLCAKLICCDCVHYLIALLLK